MIERFFRSLKEECAWLHLLESFAEAQAAVRAWIELYNTERPHQSLTTLSPAEYRREKPLRAA